MRARQCAGEVLELGSEDDLARVVQDCVKELTRLDKVGKSMPALGSKSLKGGNGKEHDEGSPALMKSLQQMGWVVGNFISADRDQSTCTCICTWMCIRMGFSPRDTKA